MKHIAAISRRRLLYILCAIGLPLIALSAVFLTTALAEGRVPAASRQVDHDRPIIVFLPTCFTSLGATTNYSTFGGLAVQQAIDAASPGATIKIAGDCFGAFVRVGLTQTAYISKPLTLIGGYTTSDWTTSNPIANPTLLDGNSAGRVIYATTNLTVENMTLQYGKNSTTLYGGGLCADSNAIISNVQFLSNTAALGGGAYVSGTLSLKGGLFRNNYGSNTGGGLYANSALTLTGTQFISNSASYAGGAGGAYANAAAALTGGLFENNQSGSSGGLAAIGTLTLTGTQFLSNTTTGSGGGASVGVGLLTNAVFRNNQSNFYGGGLDASDSLILTGTQFISNATVVGGGGVSALTVTLRGGLFQDNRTTNGPGGGLYTQKSLNLSGTQFISNSATFYGGGAYVTKAMLGSGGAFTNNHSDNKGGGLTVVGSLALTGTKFSNNTANFGGGLAIDDSSYNRLVNVIFAGNSAVSGGNAGYFEGVGSTVDLIHATIVSPTLAQPGLGYLAAIYVYQSAVNITNTIVASYSVGLYNNSGTLHEDHNLFFGVVSPTVNATTVGAHDINGDPKFLNPTAGDYHLGAGSAATGQGINAGVTTDFDGHTRPGIFGFDIGAYQYAGVILKVYLPLILKNF